MDFKDVVRRRRMIRRFSNESIEPAALEWVISAGLRAPSAGFSQGLDLVVLDSSAQIDRFWGIVDPRARKRPEPDEGPAAIVVVVSDKNAYLARYSKPDKAGLGMQREDAWPVPYWDIDAGMAALLILLAAVDEGLGAWFFGIFRGSEDLSAWLGIPEGHHPIGAIALGRPHTQELVRGSAVTQRRRDPGDAIHRGSWNAGPP